MVDLTVVSVGMYRITHVPGSVWTFGRRDGARMPRGSVPFSAHSL